MEAHEGILYIVATPIGNMGDITKRAVQALERSDAVYAEDTRVTGKLLAALDIQRPLLRLDENTIRQKSAEVIDRVLAGETISYCTDAGMPGVSDPGSYLVRAAQERDAACEVLPGASAATLAFVASGFACPNYYFGCFFPRKTAEQRDLLETLGKLDAALVFYESPKRVVAALHTIAEALPHRQVCVCRELTKLYEEVLHGSARELADLLDDRETPVKGEIVIVIDAPGALEGEEVEARNTEHARELATSLLDQGERVKYVAARISTECGVSKNAAYEMALAIRDELAHA